MGRTPDFSRDQLPDPIKRISDAAHTGEVRRSLDNYTYLAEYVYQINRPGEEPFETSLGFVEGYEPMSFEAGQAICLHGVWVEVVSVETIKERDNGLLITFYTVEIREKEGTS